MFGAPVGGAAFNYGCRTVTEDALTGAQVGGAAAAGTAAFTPDGPWDEYFVSSLRAAEASGGAFIPAIKPWKNEKVIENLRLAEAAGAVAAAMIEHIKNAPPNHIRSSPPKFIGRITADPRCHLIYCNEYSLFFGFRQTLAQ